MLSGKDVEASAKEKIKALLLKNINELVAETPTTDVSDTQEIITILSNGEE